MNSSISYDKNVQASVDKIYQFFKDPQGKVQLKKISQFLQTNKQIKKTAGIFAAKLEAIKDKKVMMRQEFQRYFSQDSSDPNHFKLVFQEIDMDKSNHISLKELRQLNTKYKINLSENDMQLMIQMVTRDGQKVNVRDLQQFLAKGL